jgi:sulfonate transport system permease protein
MSASTDDSRVFGAAAARPPRPTRVLRSPDDGWGIGFAKLPTAAVVLRLAQIATGLALPALILALWWAAAAHHSVPEQLLPTPAQVAATLHELWTNGDLQTNLAFSATRVAWSLLIGTIAGSLLGFGMGLSRSVHAYLHPSFSVVAQFPVLGWIPLLIIFVGIDEALKIAAIFIAVTVPVTINTLKGIANVPRPLLEVARVYRFSPLQTLGRVVLPAATPSLFTGLRQAVMQAWLSLVFVELLASSEGIGYLIVWGRQLSQPDLVVAGMVVIGAVGVSLDLALRTMENRLVRWRRTAF